MVLAGLFLEARGMRLRGFVQVSLGLIVAGDES